jgi:RimJ/RimL family protein N-acetyltransferase
MEVCETERLKIRQFEKSDSGFVLKLLNEESFIANIGDKNVRSTSDSINYLVNGPISSYEKFGFGLNLITLKDSSIPIGMCGLLKRDELEYADLGYALLPEYWSQGFAQEASLAILNDGHEKHNLNVIAAITNPDNVNSNNLLKKLGFSLKGQIRLCELDNNLYEIKFK